MSPVSTDLSHGYRIRGTGSLLQDPSASVKVSCGQRAGADGCPGKALASLPSTTDGAFVSKLEPEKYPLKNSRRPEIQPSQVECLLSRHRGLGSIPKQGIKIR